MTEEDWEILERSYEPEVIAQHLILAGSVGCNGWGQGQKFSPFIYPGDGDTPYSWTLGTRRLSTNDGARLAKHLLDTVELDLFWWKDRLRLMLELYLDGVRLLHQNSKDPEVRRQRTALATVMYRYNEEMKGFPARLPEEEDETPARPDWDAGERPSLDEWKDRTTSHSPSETQSVDSEDNHAS